jgi:hypothetical protein
MDVIPGRKPGIHTFLIDNRSWIPAYAGMTNFKKLNSYALAFVPTKKCIPRSGDFLLFNIEF